MTIRIKNTSGDVASLTLNGCYNIADDGIVDLEEIVDGVPLNTRPRIFADNDLHKAVADGTWQILDDEDQDVGTSALQGASTVDLDKRASIVERGTIVITNGVPTLIKTWPVPANQILNITARLAVQGTATMGRPRGGLHTVQGSAGRDGTADAYLCGSSDTETDSLPSARATFDVDGTDLKLFFQARTGDSLTYVLRYEVDQ